jgi:hypothetical protein
VKLALIFLRFASAAAALLAASFWLHSAWSDLPAMSGNYLGPGPVHDAFFKALAASVADNRIAAAWAGASAALMASATIVETIPTHWLSRRLAGQPKNDY